MPRPTVVNAKRQAVPPLSLEGLKFWLRMLQEHAVFIQAGLPCDSTGLMHEAETFQQELAALLAQAEEVANPRKFAQVVTDAQVVVGDFHRYNRRLLHLALTCQIVGCNFALFLDHLSREAEYVLLLLEKLGGGQSPLYQASSAREADFWLRLMSDHAEFVVHRLDPSERSIIETAAGFAGQFDELYLQGRDFVSMLRGETEEIPAFRRFLQDVRVSTVRFRDFLRAAECLITECKLVGLIPAQLADHLRREADHFLMVLTLLDKGCYVPVDDAGDMEYVNMEETLATTEAVPPLPEAVSPPFPPGHFGDADDEEEEEENFGEREPEIIPAPPLPPLPPQPPIPPASDQAKYKWGGKWPRPLGGKTE
ncbi:MAG: DUF2935 domain-containing protein [Negativicutes bacterium]|nr:DUF2935 domain-containing protein [Negativicutes bacterium]